MYFAILLVVVTLATWTSQTAITPKISEHIQHVLRSKEIPGLTLGVVYSNGSTELRAWGIRTEDGDATTPETMFMIASCSKAFLAASLGILMDDFSRGKNTTSLPSAVQEFRWTTKIADLLPGDWALMDEWASKNANLRDTLAHVSGVAKHDYSFSLESSPLDIVRSMRHLRPSFELRTQWIYTNMEYMVASHIVTRYSGVPYETFVQKRIFGPLGMNFTTFSLSKAENTGLLSHAWSWGLRRLPIWFPDELSELCAGPMGIYSNIVDLSKWLGLLLNDGVQPTTGEIIIPKDALKEITTPRVIQSGVSPSPGFSLSGYATGWFRQSYMGREVIWHDGGLPGFTSFVGYFPADGLGVVCLINALGKVEEYTDIVYRIVREVLDLQEPPSAPSPSSTIAHEPTYIQDPAQLPMVKPKRPDGPTLDIEKYTGTYHDPGYGTISFCTPQTDTPACKEVITEFTPVQNIVYEANSSSEWPLGLYAKHPRLFSSHIRVVHKEGDLFRLIFTYLFPEGYGRNSTAFEMWASGLADSDAQFVVKGQEVVGFGLYNMLPMPSERQLAGGDVKEFSDVWFSKI